MDTISGVVPFLAAHVARSFESDPEPLLRGSGVDAAAPPRGDEHIAVERYQAQPLAAAPNMYTYRVDLLDYLPSP